MSNEEPINLGMSPKNSGVNVFSFPYAILSSIRLFSI